MARILPDKEIRKLLNVVIFDADEQRINPTGIEIRLGKHVLFQSTDEEKELGPGMYLKVMPGESVQISSFERFDLRREALHQVFPGCDIMALITPTTTMMREGIMQSATKVESGWYGQLNWGLRNSSIRDFVLGYGEPIFKLTLFLLEAGETPDVSYGDRDCDKYQSTEGIARSTRTIPASLPKKQVVASSVERLDPAKQLREAGYPFDHIGRELTELQGKWALVSSDVLLLKTAITDETGKLSAKVEDSQKSVLEKVELLFNRKLTEVAGAIVGCISVLFGIATFLKNEGVTGASLGSVGILGGFGIFLIIFILSRRSH